MTGWIFFGVTLVAAAAAVVYLWRGRDELARANEEARAEVGSVKAEARSRVERLEREAERTRHDLRDSLLGDLFPAVDALTLARDGAADPEVRRGLELAVGEFERGLARHGVERVAPEPGAAFDPDRHEAVETLDSDELDAGTVGRCHRAGWAREGRVLRPAMVGVVRASAPAEVVFDHGSPDEDAGEVEAPRDEVEAAATTASLD